MDRIEAEKMMYQEVMSRLYCKERANYLRDTIEHFCECIPSGFLNENNVRIYAEHLSNAFIMGERFESIRKSHLLESSVEH
ncbi:MAG: hypothetical protein Q8P15_00955 [Nanoarchaeota archaeon]|nr:hypothetical protein [Nanoarchaeota archaeon]